MFEKLREMRINKNISVDEIASVLNLETKAAYYKKEAGTVKFTLIEAKKVADYFGMTIEEIFFANEVSEMETKLKETG